MQKQLQRMEELDGQLKHATADAEAARTKLAEATAAQSDTQVGLGSHLAGRCCSCHACSPDLAVQSWATLAFVNEVLRALLLVRMDLR